MICVKAPCFDMSKNIFSPVVCMKCLSDQGNTGSLLKLDLLEKELICSKKSTKSPAEINHQHSLKLG